MHEGHLPAAKMAHVHVLIICNINVIREIHATFGILPSADSNQKGFVKPALNASFYTLEAAGRLTMPTAGVSLPTANARTLLHPKQRRKKLTQNRIISIIPTRGEAQDQMLWSPLR